MKALASIILLFFCLSPLFAHSSVWKVTKGEEILYLGGTIHVLRPGDFPLPAEFDRAYERSGTVVFETDLSATASDSFAAALSGRMMLPSGQTLGTTLKPSAYGALKTYLLSQGSDIRRFEKLRPWAVMLLLTQSVLAQNGIDRDGVDEHYSRRAEAEGKERLYLETPAEQIRLITGIAEGEEDAVILQTLREMQMLPAMIDWLVREWREGKTERIERELVQAMKRESPLMYRRLLSERNRAWIPELIGMMREGKKGFVLVGAMHLSGPDGLLALLKKKGYTVEPYAE